MLLHERITEYCSRFKLPGVLEHYQYLADNAAKEKMSYSEYLCKLFELENSGRELRGRQMVLKMAGLPKLKTIDTFDFKSSSVDKTLINEILTLRFIDECKNILLFGPSGVGKTHLATAIAYAVTQERIKIKFITASDLMIQLEAAVTTNRLDNYFKRTIGISRVLVIDEFGYVKFNETQANLFFQVINKKYEIGSIIITSNLSFTKWKEVLNNDEALTTAILDRLIHHSHLINITGESYRLKQKREAGLLNISVK
ncbi:IS21-like element helper ATPase IstB [Sulfurimonas sp.]|uniref:IS21-like element helper ATPase IstB n=1 Tax=Sulfurimonas sp. TaxID=2022749 RepID=UPI003D116CEB